VDTPQINHISLCAGYGGIDLGLRRILPSLRNLAYCEIEVFPIANLVSKIESGQLDEAPIFTNLKTFNAKPFRGMVDILSGGFPCQPFSCAGVRKGTDDPRHLFPDIERIILECEPRIIFLENVEGIISSKLGGEENTSVLKHVLERLEKMGYRATAGIFSAEEVGAPHRRKRVFIAGVSNNDCERFVREQESNSKEGTLEKPCRDNFDGCCSELSDTESFGCGRRTTQIKREGGENQQEGCKVGREITGCDCSSGEKRQLDNTDSCDEKRNCRKFQRTSTEMETQVSQSSDPEHTGGNAGKGDKLGLGNTEHDGSFATQKRGSVKKTSSGCEKGESQTKQSAGTSGRKSDESVSGGEGHGELGDTTSKRSCRGGEDECGQQPEMSGSRFKPTSGGSEERELSNSNNERLEGGKREGEAGKEGESIGHATESYSKYPSRPKQPQQWWEFPRTIGETEEIIVPVGCSTYGYPASLVRTHRNDALRMLGNGVVPDCAAKAFVCLMHELNERKETNGN